MAGIRADIDLRVNTQNVKKSLDKATNEINKVVSKVSGRPISFNVNQKSFTQPLGRINASANEFTKSLEASNARVIAFGASVAILDGISNSFKGLVREAVKFEKTLADINVVLNLSNAQLRQFGEGLFDTARKTAQGFNVASEAALEFSRQGLSTEEVLRRTNDALILTRLTSLKAADAVAGLTAAVNAFADAGLTTTDIIDKLSAVDVKFAVSSEDLINALQRAGAVAIDAGVEFDSLIGLVAALQQTTARGGAVIGNSLKTIFTRIQRPESLKQLEEMGVAIRDISGAVLPADRILLNISKTFDRLTQAQQSNVVQFSAGIFQANVFRAALRDLSKEQSLHVRATQVAANAAGEAAMKNELLNKTVAALASQAGTNIQELGAILGDLALGPELADALEFVNKRVEEIRGALGGGENEGSTFAKGLVKGIGNIISGPGAIAFGAIFIKLFINIAKFASSSMRDVLGIVTQKQKIKQMQESIVNVLLQEKNIQQGLNSLEGDRVAQEKFILGILERQANAMREQQLLAKRLAPVLIRSGVSPDLGAPQNSVDFDGDGKKDTFSSGLIPEDIKREKNGARKGGYTPGSVKKMKVRGLGDVVYNTAEKVKYFDGMNQPAIMPPDSSKAGQQYKKEFNKKHGFDPYASKGFVPNFAQLFSGLNSSDSNKKAAIVGNTNILELPPAKMLTETSVTQGTGAKAKKMTGWHMMEAALPSVRKHIISYKDELEGLEKLGVNVLRRYLYFTDLEKRGDKKGAIAAAAKYSRKGYSTKAVGTKYEETLHSKYLKDKGYLSTHDQAKVDFIGEGKMPLEGKYGKLESPNLIAKSIRLYGDKSIPQFLQSKGSRELASSLKNKNFQDSLKVLEGAGVETKNLSLKEQLKLVKAYNLHDGFIPSFANMYQVNDRRHDGRFKPGLFAYPNLFFEKQSSVHDVLKTIQKERQRFNGSGDKDQVYGITTFQMPDQNLKAMLSGVYSAGQIKKLRTLSNSFLDWRSPDYIEDDEEEYLISNSLFDMAEHRELFEEDKARKKGFEYIRGKNQNPIRGTKENPMPLARKGNLARFNGAGYYDIPDAGQKSGVRDSFSISDEEKIRKLFGLKEIKVKEIDAGYLSNLEFADILAGGDSNKIRAAQEGGMGAMKFAKSMGHVPNFAGSRKAYKVNWSDVYEKIIKYPGGAPTIADLEQELFPGMSPGKLRSLNARGLFKNSAQRAFINYFSSNPGGYTKTQAEDKLKQVKKVLQKSKGGSYAKQLGTDFEEALRKFLKIPKPSGEPHMDFPAGSLGAVNKADADSIFLSSTSGGDAYRGITGHPEALFVSKYIRQRISGGSGHNYPASNPLMQRITNFAAAPGGGNLELYNKGDYTDIIGIADGSRKDDNVNAKPTLEDVFARAKTLKRTIEQNLEKKKNKIQGESKKTISLSYIKDYVSSMSGGFVPNFAVQLGSKYFDRSQVKQGLAKLYKSKTGKKADARALDRAAEKYIALIEDTGRTYPGGDFMIGDKRVMANEVALALMNHGQFYKPKEGETVQEFSKGLIPNFANPLKDAIEREKAAGIPASNIRVEQSNQLRGPGNPMGLAVTNTRDEPAGVGQGIRRAKSMGLDPKTHGAARGFVPNFETEEIQDARAKGITVGNKKLNEATEERIESEERAKDAIDRNSQSNMESLQKLFYLQSGISMANGFLQQFAEEGDATTKKMAELGMGVSNVVSTMITLKEFSGMLAGFSGQPDKAVGLGNLLGRAGKSAPMKGLTNTLGIGKISKVVGTIGTIGKGLLRFAPVVGQVTMGLTILHETLKAFDVNVFDLFKDNADRAADKLEKLSESAEKTQSALDEANNLSATRDKMSKLEILGSQRTLKQEKELINLKIKEIKQQTSLQSKIAKVDTAHLKNKNLINEINKVKAGEIKGTEAMVRVLEKIAKQEAVQAAFATAIKDFSKKTEDEFGFFESGGPSKELKPELKRLANTIAEITVGLAPERKQAMKESLAAGNIQGIAGLESLDLETAEKKQFFINALQKQIEVSEREFEDDKKIQQAKAGALNEYVKIVANYKKQTEQIAHQNNLDNIISASKRKINASLIDLQSEYQMISKSTAIQNKTALEAAAITQKLESDKLKANNEALNGLETLRKEYMNIGKIASRFNSDAKDAQVGVAEFKKAITTGLSPQKISEVGDILGNQTPQQIQEINSFFAELGEEIKDLNDNQEIVNKLTKKYGDTQDATLRQAVMLLMHKMELTNIEQDHIELVKKINNTLRRSNETSEATAKAARAGLENETALNLIKQKTVEGARKLMQHMLNQGNASEAITKNMQGEADTLAVINHFQKSRIDTLLKSGALDQKAFEEQVAKNRTDAEAAILSLRQLQAQEKHLRNSDDFEKIQIAKIQSEILGAKLTAEDADFRNKFLSYNANRESLIQAQINEETTTLETTARNNLTKLKLLAGSEQLKKQIDLQIQEEVTSAQSSALINSEKALILSAMGKQGLLLQKANELQESSNKLTELQNAIRKAAVSKEELALSVGTDLAIEKAGAIRGTREAGMRATMTGSPEDALAFAQSLKETNKLLGEGSRAFDTLRVKIAEMDVAAENLGGDLVEIGLNQTRSGMKQLFKDIGSGAKSAKEAWKDFGLGLADVLLDRMMEHNIDQIIKNLTFAFTGENALSEAEKIAGSNNSLITENQKLVNSLDALAVQVEAQKRALENDIANRSDIASRAGASDYRISDPNFDTSRANKISAAAMEEQAKKSAEILAAKEKEKLNKQKQLDEAQQATNAAIESARNAQLLKDATKAYKDAIAEAANQARLAALAAQSSTNKELVDFINAKPVNNFTEQELKVLDPGNNFFGGRIQKFAKGGFVEGQPGVDKVPAMLTAGEFVVPKKEAKALKDGGMLQYFEEGGVAERVKAGAKGLAQGFVMQEVAKYVAGKMQEKKADKPPQFNMNKFKNLNLNSTVSIGRGDPRSSGKLLAKDPVMEEYRQHLLDVASYRAAQKNKKVSERMSKIGSIVGTVASFAMNKLTSVAAKPLNTIFEKGKNLALGKTGIGEHSDAWKAAQKDGIKVDYSTIAESAKSGKPFEYNNNQYLVTGPPSSSVFEAPARGFKTGIDRNQRNLLTGQTADMFSGGEIPAMLTAGESFIPAPIAKRIGYDNLNKMNRTGSLPIIQGPGGIDNVGPVGLSEGDFIIRRSSTDKLLRENPNMMRFAMQNPDGFRKAEQGYYQGGIVGTSSSPNSSVSAPQKTSGTKPAPVAENRISSLLEGTQANQKETVATNQNTEVTNNINVNVTIDKSGNEKVSTEGAQGTYDQEQQLAMKIKSRVLEVIREEKRIGGELSG